MAFDPFDALTNMTRRAMDDYLQKELLSKHTSAYAKLMMDPITQHGASLSGNIYYKEHEGRWVNTGVEQYGREILDPYATINLHWVRFIKNMTVDGFDYELNTGQALESVLSGDNGSFSVGGARTLIAQHKEELMQIHGEVIRAINKAIYTGENVTDPESAGFQGFQQIMDPDASYGGIAPDGLGQHDWVSSLTGQPPNKWSPIYYDAGGQAVSLFGEIESIMIDLAHGGSKFTPMGLENEYWMFISQRQYSNIQRHEALRGVLRRPVSESGGANPDISGFKQPLVWDSYNLYIWPDTDCPDTEIYIFNKKCVRFGQITNDQRFMRKWRIGSEQDTIMIPFYKTCQLWCDDRSQTGRITNIGGAGITE